MSSFEPGFSPPVGSHRPSRLMRAGAFLRRAVWRLVKIFLFLMVLGAVIGVSGLWYFSRDLPRIDELFLSFRRPCIRLFDARGTLMATYGDVYGDVLTVDVLPPHVVQALLAVEDKRFYNHFGIDFTGIVRAFWQNYRSGRVVQGGSTISQQLGKNILQAHKLYEPTDRSLKRKIQETILALLLEAKLTKNQILTLYLNRVYFGSGTFGVDAAAKRYFGRSARDLTLYEAAMLMGLLKAPSRYSPANSPEKSEARTRQVLERMVRAGFINTAAMDATFVMASPPPDVTNQSSVHYFTDWVVDCLRSLVSLNQDLDVYTTIDLSLQKKAERHMKKAMETYGKNWNAGQMALVCMTPGGSVKTMIGGMSYTKSKFNRVTQALRQPGSLFKFFTYLTAMRDDLMPEHRISDGPVSVGKWSPKNYLYQSQGLVTLQNGFAKSINTMAVRLAMILRVPRILETARELGITTPIPNNLSIALGSGETTLLEMTGAFAVIPNSGIAVKPYGITRVLSKQGHVLYQHVESEQRLLSPTVVARMLQMMKVVVTDGTGRRTKLKEHVSGGKTGTSQNYRDLWYIGFTPQLVTGVWTGRDSDRPMTRVNGGSPSSHLWREFMETALSKTPVSDFEVPQSEDVRAVDAELSALDNWDGFFAKLAQEDTVEAKEEARVLDQVLEGQEPAQNEVKAAAPKEKELLDDEGVTEDEIGQLLENLG